MTKSELIKALEAYPDDMPVWLCGPMESDDTVPAFEVGSGIPSSLRKKGSEKKKVIIIQA